MNLTDHVFLEKHRNKLTMCLENKKDDPVCPVYEFAGFGFVLLKRIDTTRELVKRLNQILKDLDFIRMDLKEATKNEDFRVFNRSLLVFDDTTMEFIEDFEVNKLIHDEKEKKEGYDQDGIKKMKDLFDYLKKLQKSLRNMQDKNISGTALGKEGSTEEITTKHQEIKDINFFFENRIKRLLKSSDEARNKVFYDEKINPSDSEYKNNLHEKVKDIAVSADIFRASAFR